MSYIKRLCFLLIGLAPFMYSGKAAKKNIILFINGNPGVGKSTISDLIRKIDDKYGFIVMSWDMMFMELCVPSKYCIKYKAAKQSYSKYLRYEIKASKLKFIEGPEYDNLNMCFDQWVGILLSSGHNVIVDRCLNDLSVLKKLGPDFIKNTQVYLILICRDDETAIAAQKIRNKKLFGVECVYEDKADAKIKYDLIVENNTSPGKAARTILKHINNNPPNAIFSFIV